MPVTVTFADVMIDAGRHENYQINMEILAPFPECGVISYGKRQHPDCQPEEFEKRTANEIQVPG